MGFADWNPQFTVHNAEMDKQHEAIFRLVNELHAGIFTRKTRDTLSTTIKELIDYTERHFAEEERLMHKYGYPDQERHKAAHTQLLEQVLEFERKFLAGDNSFTAEMFQFLVSDWLVKHILGMDKLYAPYLKS